MSGSTIITCSSCPQCCAAASTRCGLLLCGEQFGCVKVKGWHEKKRKERVRQEERDENNPCAHILAAYSAFEGSSIIAALARSDAGCSCTLRSPPRRSSGLSPSAKRSCVPFSMLTSLVRYLCSLSLFGIPALHESPFDSVLSRQGKEVGTVVALTASMICPPHTCAPAPFYSEGFHTFDYARHFLSCASRMLGLEHVTSRGSITIDYYGRNVGIKVMHYPLAPHGGLYLAIKWVLGEEISSSSSR